MRVVLDTNVIVSGFIWEGRPRMILVSVTERKVELCLTSGILDEIKRVLQYPKIVREMKKAGIVSEEVIGWLFQHSSVFTNSDLVKVVASDPTDDVFINCAIVSGATFIISGDKHLKDIGSYRGIEIVSPAEFCKRF